MWLNFQILKLKLKIENLKIELLLVEKYCNPLVAEGESISPMTKTLKKKLISAVHDSKRKLAGIDQI
jgi:hypothetical protein